MFLSSLGTSWNVKFGKPKWQLVPNVGCARGNTIKQWKSGIPGKTAAKWLFVALMELLDQHTVLPHRLATLTKYQTEISCWPCLPIPYWTEVSQEWSNCRKYLGHQYLGQFRKRRGIPRLKLEWCSPANLDKLHITWKQVQKHYWITFCQSG